LYWLSNQIEANMIRNNLIQILAVMIAIQSLLYGYDGALFDDLLPDDSAEPGQVFCADDFAQEEEVCPPDSQADVQSDDIQTPEVQNGFFEKHKYKVISAAIASVVGIKMLMPLSDRFSIDAVRNVIRYIKQYPDGPEAPRQTPKAACSHCRELEQHVKQLLNNQKTTNYSKSECIKCTTLKDELEHRKECSVCFNHLPHWAFVHYCFEGGHSICFRCVKDQINGAMMTDNWPPAPDSALRSNVIRCGECRGLITNDDAISQVNRIVDNFSGLIKNLPAQN